MGKDIGTFFGAAGGSTIEMEELARKADKAAVQFCALIRQLIEQRRRQPGTDMISLLSVAYQEQGFNLRNSHLYAFRS
jgi:cytochrome P450